MEVSTHQIEVGKTFQKELSLKADREVIQQLLKEQAKINEFRLARFTHHDVLKF